MSHERHTRRMRATCLWLAAWLSAALFARGGEPLVWRPDRNEMDADIRAWSLPKVLEKLTAVTGWRIYVEPEAERLVSSRFEKLPPAEALNRLFGDLSFALLSTTNAPARLFVYRTAVEQATHRVQAPRTDASKAGLRIIGNELVVTLKPGSKLRIDQLAQRLGAKVVGRLEGQNTYRLRFESDEAAQQARAQASDEEDVASVDLNYALPAPGQIEAMGGPGSVSPPALKPGTLPNGQYVAVALIDTPVQREGTSLNDFLLPNVSLTGETTPPTSGITHGTAMAETILAAAASNLPGTDGMPVRILPMDVYGDQTTTSTFEVATALQSLLATSDSRIQIVNLSLGSSADAPYVRPLIQALHEQGVLIVGAAGNDPVSTPVYPAAYPEVLAVTAGDGQGNIAPYANRGEFVDAVMPGTSVVYYEGQQYLVTGTSPAAATASGTVAADVANTGSTPQAAASQLRHPPVPSRPGG